MGKMGLLLCCLILIVSLSACGGRQEIVGRWELEKGNYQSAFEFYNDGTGAMFSSIDPFYPMAGLFTYKFDPKSGDLEVIPTGEATERTILFNVAFESKDKISVDEKGFVRPGFVRKSLPELPPGARARIGSLMLGKDFTFTEAEKLRSGWESDFIALSSKNPSTNQNVAIWLVSLQVEGDSKLLILGEIEGQPYKWDAISVIAAPKNVPAEVMKEVESQSPGAIILSAHRSELMIEDINPWCVVFKEYNGTISRLIYGDNWLIKDVTEEDFEKSGCTNP